MAHVENGVRTFFYEWLHSFMSRHSFHGVSNDAFEIVYAIWIYMVPHGALATIWKKKMTIQNRALLNSRPSEDYHNDDGRKIN